MFTGASTSDHVDGVLARANAYNMRAPYQNVPDLRKRINAHDCHYFDRHLSEMAQEVRYGTYGPIDFAIIEAADITPDGEIVLGCGVGNVPTYAMLAKKSSSSLTPSCPSRCSACTIYICRSILRVVAKYLSMPRTTAWAAPC